MPTVTGKTTIVRLLQLHEIEFLFLTGEFADPDKVTLFYC